MKLSEEHQQKILDAWNSSKDEPPSLMELTELCFGKGFDGRSKEGRAVKSFLATRDIKARGTHEYKAKETIDLSDENKEFIRNNVSTMSGLEIAKIIFANNELSNLHQETRTVNNYIKELENSENIEVNSAHHQSVNKLGKDFVSCAIAPDGIIEGIEHINHPWCIGLQWHPEFLITNADSAIIEDFVSYAK